jgi:threonylcarbamoyladenosine tRNA methylthiotransferase MtaB
VIREVRDLVAAGYREVVLTGVHVGGYGRTGPGAGDRNALADLMARVLAETALPRLRLSSIEVFEVTPALVRLYANEPRLVPHLHVPVQSGSARTLARMKRRYHPDRFRRVVRRLRDAVEDCAISTDVIVGFPGETEADFAETLALLEETRIMKTHVFPYSRRSGTPAAGMPDPVPAAELRDRVRRCDRLGRRLARDWATSRLGRTATVLVESRRIRGWLTGYTERYVRVFFEGPDDLMGRLVPVRLTALAPDGVRAEGVAT